MEKEYEAVKRALTRFAPGKEMIDLEMFDRDGNSVRLADVKGDLVYVDIWASWCGSCCYEMAFLEKLVERYKDSLHLEVVSLSIDKNEKPGWQEHRKIVPAGSNIRLRSFHKEFLKKSIILQQYLVLCCWTEMEKLLMLMLLDLLTI